MYDRSPEDLLLSPHHICSTSTIHSLPIPSWESETIRPGSRVRILLRMVAALKALSRLLEEAELGTVVVTLSPLVTKLSRKLDVTRRSFLHLLESGLLSRLRKIPLETKVRNDLVLRLEPAVLDSKLLVVCVEPVDRIFESADPKLSVRLVLTPDVHRVDVNLLHVVVEQVLGEDLFTVHLDLVDGLDNDGGRDVNVTVLDRPVASELRVLGKVFVDDLANLEGNDVSLAVVVLIRAFPDLPPDEGHSASLLDLKFCDKALVSLAK
jgi:hypothetical protein